MFSIKALLTASLVVLASSSCSLPEAPAPEVSPAFSEPEVSPSESETVIARVRRERRELQEREASLTVPMPADLPAWLVGEMKESTGLQLWKFQHEGQLAYYIVSGNGDDYNPVFTGEGDYVCSPNGGMTGRGDEKCPSKALADRGDPILLVWASGVYADETLPTPALDRPYPADGR